MEHLDNRVKTAIESIQAANLEGLEFLRISLFGKKGIFAEYMKQMAKLDNDKKPAFGAIINKHKDSISMHLNTRRELLESEKIQQTLNASSIDVTLPGCGHECGHIHPITQTIDKVVQIFSLSCYTIASGPEIEHEYFNFEALNIPSHHPARTMHDTFYFDTNYLLRTHTSTVQIRTMQQSTPPIRILCPGRVYRSDYDITHSPMFHQIEGLYIDEGINFAHLKGTITSFLQAFFGENLGVRFRPSFFPFTEPSAEVDIECSFCHGNGCRVCKHTGWIEIMGCGMVHPNVLNAVNIDTQKYSGFAFGMGVERLAMLSLGIPDLRTFFNNDIKFLKQF